MKKLLPIFLAIAGSFVIPAGCAHSDDGASPMLGKWKSLWGKKSVNMKNDFNIIFKNDHSFNAEALGIGEIQSQKVSGYYKTIHDTLVIHDIFEEPKQLCSYADTGVYTFKQVNDTMYFKVVKDLCERRKLTFEIGLYKSP